MVKVVLCKANEERENAKAASKFGAIPNRGKELVNSFHNNFFSFSTPILLSSRAHGSMKYNFVVVNKNENN